MSEKTIVAFILDSRTKHLVGKVTSLSSYRPQNYLKRLYENGDLGNDDAITTDGAVSTQMEGCTSSFIPMLEDSERR